MNSKTPYKPGPKLATKQKLLEVENGRSGELLQSALPPSAQLPKRRRREAEVLGLGVLFNLQLERAVKLLESWQQNRLAKFKVAFPPEGAVRRRFLDQCAIAAVTPGMSATLAGRLFTEYPDAFLVVVNALRRAFLGNPDGTEPTISKAQIAAAMGWQDRTVPAKQREYAMRRVRERSLKLRGKMAKESASQAAQNTKDQLKIEESVSRAAVERRMVLRATPKELATLGYERREKG